MWYVWYWHIGIDKVTFNIFVIPDFRFVILIYFEYVKPFKVFQYFNWIIKKDFLSIIDKWFYKLALSSCLPLRHLITTFVSKCVNNVWTWRSTIFVVDLLNIKGNMRGEREREREREKLRLFKLICIIHIIFTLLQMIIRTLFYGYVHVVVIITERNNFCSRTRFYVYGTISLILGHLLILWKW